MAKKFLVPFILACMMLSACSGALVDVSPDEQSDAFDVDLISTLNLAIGETSNLVLDIQPHDGAEVNTSELEVTWVNSNQQAISLSDSKSPEIAVTGLSSGEATVTAMVGNLAAASCRVTVSNGTVVEVLGLSVSENTKSFVYDPEGSNNSFGLVAQIQTNPAVSNINVNWSSTVTSVATVTPRGTSVTVNVLGPGETDIVATLGKFTDRCRLSVTSAGDPNVLSVSLNITSKSMEVGETLQLVATKSGNVQFTKWQSSNGAVASVNNDGLVTALSAGESTISVTVGDGDSQKSATCKVNVAASGSSSDYDQNLPESLKQKGHIYFHYLRTSDSNYDDWALWIWQSFPNSLEGSLWGANAAHFSSSTPIKQYREGKVKSTPGGE